MVRQLGGFVSVRFAGATTAFERPRGLDRALVDVAAALERLRLDRLDGPRRVVFAAGGPQVVTGRTLARVTGLPVLDLDAVLCAFGPGGSLDLELVAGPPATDHPAVPDRGYVPLDPWRPRREPGEVAEEVRAPAAGRVDGVEPEGPLIAGRLVPLPAFRRRDDRLQASRLTCRPEQAVAQGQVVGVWLTGGYELREVVCRPAHGVVLCREVADDPKLLDHRGIRYRGAGAVGGDLLVARRGPGGDASVRCPAGTWQVWAREEDRDGLRLVLIAP